MKKHIKNTIQTQEISINPEHIDKWRVYVSLMDASFVVTRSMDASFVETRCGERVVRA